MQKSAQKRRLVDKLREKIDIGGIAAEKFFTPEFKEIMDKLRNEVDDPVRAILSGSAVGESSAPDDAVGIKDLLKNIKSNINRREYMKAVADLGRFHKKLYDVSQILSNFKYDIDKIHEKFLFEGLDEDVKKHLFELKGRLTANYNVNNFTKSANIMDFFSNIMTERGRALSAWEKRYPKQVGKLKSDTLQMLRKSESLTNSVLSILKDMATARAGRNVDKYLELANKIVRLYNTYDAGFKDFYNTNVKGFLEKQQLMQAPSVKVDEREPGELSTQEIPVAKKVESIPPSVEEKSVYEEDPVTEIYEKEPITEKKKVIEKPEISVEQKLPIPSEKAIHSVQVRPVSYKKEDIITGEEKTEFTPKTIKDEDLAPETIKEKTMIGVAPPPPIAPVVLPKSNLISPPANTNQQKKSHYEFYKTLEKMSNESPIILTSFIKKYAQSIQYSDVETSIKLLKLIKDIGE